MDGEAEEIVEKILDVLFSEEYSGFTMKNIVFKFIFNFFSFEKTNEKKLNNVKFLKVYLDSVGQRYYYNYGGQYSVSNKEFHRQIWNKSVKAKTDYEIFKSTID